VINPGWVTTNATHTTYRDGTTIPQVTDPTTWGSLTTGAWCYYDNSSANDVVYGKLYNWYAVAGIYNTASLTNVSLRKQFAPVGFILPTYSDLDILVTCLGGSNIAGGKMKETGTSHWNSPNTGAVNSCGFNGLPGGSRGNTGTFIDKGNIGRFWTSTEFDNSYSYFMSLAYNNTVVFFNVYTYKSTGYSVRLLQV
jgi:uncharacterized protein (TIGR02145 family)